MVHPAKAAKVKTKIAQYMFVLPAMIFLLAFIVYPIFYNIILSVCKIELSFFAKREYNFIGLQNYINLFKAADGLLLLSIKNTIIFTVISIPFLILLSFGLALLLQKDTRLNRTSRAILLIGYILPQSVTSMIFRLMFLKDGGIINYLFMVLGLIETPIGFLINETWAMAVVIIANVWISFPFSMLLFTAGLGTLDEQIVEAAMIDGAGWWRRLFSIVIPSIKDTITIVLTLGVINTFKVFDLVYIMTGGGPGNSTQMLSTYSYKLSFSLFKYDQGAAVANVLFIILFLVGLVYIKTIKKGDDY